MEDEANSSNYPNQYQSKKTKLAHEIHTHITEEISNLPEEIIVEIMARLRLPVKSLLKFRCVSKLWLSIISSPQFIKSHLKISKNDATLDNHRILFTVSTPCILLKQCTVNSVLYEPSDGVFDVDYPKRRLDRSVGVVGTCNGLVCIAINEKKMFLWNPATRASTRLPPLNVELKPGFYYLYGFGYDERGDDYKVISIFVDYGNGTQCKSLVKMYSLKNNSWKTIDNFQGRIPYSELGKFASGKLHFSASPGLVHDERWDITSIDLSTEVYGIVEQPNYGEGHFDFTWDVLEGCICVLSHYGTNYADLWVLKEYGVKESWTKMVTMSYINKDYRGSLLSGPLLMMPGGKILMALGYHLVVYNPKDSNVRYLELSNLKRGFLEVDLYAESLVSPAAG